jgi:peptidoglycan/xylan/chitin deacetylase (PgdA/CDA1 family)
MFVKKMTHIILFALVTMTHNVFAAVILQYHHVSEKLPAITSVSSETFKSHLQYLQTNNFNVVPLDTLLNKIKDGETINANTIAITFDDGYDNNITDAAPILEAFNYPYTIFVNPQLIDENQSYVMTWEQLRTLSKKGALIANHSAKHDYLHKRLKGESQTQWYQRVSQDIIWSEQRIKKEIGHNAKLLAYPYGEFNNALQQLVSDLGFTGIGQHSGAIGSKSNFTRLPRFPASGIYGNLNTLKTKIHAHPFAIDAIKYNDSVTTDTQPIVTLTFANKPFQNAQFACFVSGVGAATLDWIDNTTVSVTTPKPLPLGRSRYNCTAPVKNLSGAYYWYSQPWVITQ